MKVILKTPFTSETVVLKKDKYTSNGALALIAFTPDGDPFATLSVNITDGTMPSDVLPPDHCYFKDWSENEGMLESLEAQGAVKRMGVSVQTGFVSAPLVKVLF